MTSRARYAPLLFTLALTAPGEARAAERACPPLPVALDPVVGARWPDLPQRIRDALEGRGDVDPCARITIRMNRSAFVLEVVLPDGRSASRPLSRGEDVVPTLEALLLLPSGAPPPAAEPALVATSVGAARPHAASGAGAVLSAVAEPVPAAPAARFRLEFSLATGLRVGDGQVGFSLGALTFFDLRGWLLGFEGAADHYEGAGDRPPADVLRLGLLTGRRFRFEHAALDLTFGPAMALRGLGSRRAVSAEAGSQTTQAPPAANDGPWARLLGGVRVTFRPRALVRPFTGVEGELALERSGTAVPSAEPQLPAWVVGLVAGATVGTP